MKRRILAFLQKLGAFQAQVLLAVIFFGVVTPYAWVLRLFGRPRTGSGGWFDSPDRVATLATLRRSF